MALSDKWTRAQLRTAVRRELMDPNSKWWTNAELDQSLSDWQDELQQTFEFVWGTCTVEGSQALHTLSTLSSAPLRLDAVYWSDAVHSEERLVGKTKQELDNLFREWRYLNVATPKVVVQIDPNTIQLVPPPDVVGTLNFEHPRQLTLDSDETLVALPAWTQPSAIPYCCYRAYKRLGPNQDLFRSAYYKSRFAAARERIRNIYTSYFPYHYPSLRPATSYERDILHPSIGGSTTLPGIITRAVLSELALAGSIDASNRVFTLGVSPTVMMLYKNGQLLTPTVDYTLAGSTITMTLAPALGDILRALGV